MLCIVQKIPDILLVPRKILACQPFGRNDVSAESSGPPALWLDRGELLKTDVSFESKDSFVPRNDGVF